MTWARLDDQFPDHPKVDPLSDLAFRIHVAAICHSARYLTDGFIAQERVSRLAPRYKPAAVSELEAAKLWEVVAGGWHIHDYTDFNPSAEEVARTREADRLRKARQRATADRDTANGQFVSRRDTYRDTHQDNRRDSARSPNGSHARSPAVPVPVLKSSPLAVTQLTTAENPKTEEEESLNRQAQRLAQADLENFGGEIRNPKAWLAKATQRRLDELRAGQPNPQAEVQSAENLGRNWASVIDNLDEARDAITAKFPGRSDLADVALRAWNETG